MFPLSVYTNPNMATLLTALSDGTTAQQPGSTSQSEIVTKYRKQQEQLYPSVSRLLRLECSQPDVNKRAIAAEARKVSKVSKNQSDDIRRITEPISKIFALPESRQFTLHADIKIYFISLKSPVFFKCLSEHYFSLPHAIKYTRVLE